MHPAFYYISALLCEGLQTEDVLSACLHQDVPGASERMVEHIFSQLHPIPHPQSIRNDFSRTTTQWLRERGVYLYFRERENFEFCLRLRRNRNARSVIERGLLAKLSVKEIHSFVAKDRMFRDLRERHLRMYQHYFWNLTLLTDVQIQDFLRDNALSAFYREALEGGKDLLLHRLGVDLPYTNEQLHTMGMRQVGLRLLSLSHQTFDELSDKRASQLGSVFTRMFRNAMNAGGARVEEAREDLRQFVESTEKPNLTAYSPKREPISSDDDEEDDNEV